MTERAIIVHKSCVQKWATRDQPPLPLPMILRALARMNEVMSTLPPQDIVVVEESPDTGFVYLPERVGIGNSARLYGARAGCCLRIARSVLENARIEVTLDEVGALP